MPRDRPKVCHLSTEAGPTRRPRWPQRPLWALLFPFRPPVPASSQEAVSLLTQKLQGANFCHVASMNFRTHGIPDPERRPAKLAIATRGATTFFQSIEKLGKRPFSPKKSARTRLFGRFFGHRRCVTRRLLACDRRFHPRRVTPEPLQIILFPYILFHDVDDDVEKIHHDPTRSGVALRVTRSQVMLLREGVQNLRFDGPQMRFG